jgi:hypothetical protein
MDLARRGNLHSLHQEVLQHLGEKRAMLGRKDLFPQDQRVAVNISGVTARVLRIGKASCPTRPAVMSLQHREEITSRNGTSQALPLIYPLEILRLPRIMLVPIP